jgi:hypothetical protein
MLKVQSIIQKTILTVILSVSAISGYCQNDDENLYLYTKSAGEATVYSMDEINKITFTKNGIQIWNTNWPTEYAYSNVHVLTFNGNILPNGWTGTAGDANGDGIINAADIVEVINYINGSPSDIFDLKRADANGDGIVNGSDIDMIVNHIMTH